MSVQLIHVFSELFSHSFQHTIKVSLKNMKRMNKMLSKVRFPCRQEHTVAVLVLSISKKT